MSSADLPQVVLITGSGRSGTTWLGEMMRTNRSCTYKYEPFPPYKDTPYHGWVEALASADAVAHRNAFFDIARRGYIDVDRPPFTSDALKTPAQPLPWLYRLCSKIDQIKPLYTAATRFDLTDAPVLVKDVWIPNSYLPRFVEVMSPKIVTIVRHPYASIASALRGIDMGVFEGEISAKRDRIRRLHASFEAFADPDGFIERLDDLNPTQLEALRWRLEAEPTAAYVDSIDDGYIVVYERLVKDPLGELEGIFDFLGWKIGAHTESFIEESQRSDTNDGKAQYYSTKRTADEALDGWRKNVSAEQVADIESVVAASPLLSLWP